MISTFHKPIAVNIEEDLFHAVERMVADPTAAPKQASARGNVIAVRYDKGGFFTESSTKFLVVFEGGPVRWVKSEWCKLVLE